VILDLGCGKAELY